MGSHLDEGVASGVLDPLRRVLLCRIGPLHVFFEAGKLKFAGRVWTFSLTPLAFCAGEGYVNRYDCAVLYFLPWPLGDVHLVRL